MKTIDEYISEKANFIVKKHVTNKFSNQKEINSYADITPGCFYSEVYIDDTVYICKASMKQLVDTIDIEYYITTRHGVVVHIETANSDPITKSTYRNLNSEEERYVELFEEWISTHKKEYDEVKKGKAYDIIGKIENDKFIYKPK